MTETFTAQMAARAQEWNRRAIELIKEDNSAAAIEALIMANDYLEILNPTKQVAA
ncbi:MAG TPA: hypothetical protein VLZ84_07135 [Asticcacaulis sp.]|nr:hypothetical protein [Asticcacaulis sp.]